MIEKLLPSLREAWMSSSHVIVAFGSPREGLREILMKEGIDIREAADFVINTIANQGVQVVRTEEAIIATLALLNILE
jgi:predicted SPOUT superfamily RNA methylase MTH1